MRNYRIAFFTADWNYELVESTLRGMKQYVDEHPNIRLYVFDCFGKETNSSKDRSEYGIYDLPDLRRFDGALIQGNQIVQGRVRNKLVRKITDAGIPAVIVDCPADGCTLVGIDNRQAQYDIADHVIRHHGARKLVYLTGLIDNGCPEGIQRQTGFQDACLDNGLSAADWEIFECTWRTSDGLRVAERWARNDRPLPDAFVCANDEMALGVMEGLKNAGIRVPQDVIVTGFDNVTSAELTSPRLSTVHRDNGKLNDRAREILLRKINGESIKGENSFPHQLICSESCGCGESSAPDYIRNKYFQQTRFLKNFYTLQDSMAEELFETQDLPELMDIVEKNNRIFGCDNVFLCINDYYFDNYDKNQWQQDSEGYGKEMVLAACGQTALKPDSRHQYFRFPSSSLLPERFLREDRFLVFYPLHYNTYSIGYLVMNGISEAAKLNLHKSIFSFLEIAMENVRKKCLLRQFNEMLDDLYVHDGLTGLYNRFGFDRFAQVAYDDFISSDGGAQILFVDMDNMKKINDQWGHEFGDAALRATAKILQGACGAKAFLMRYGGDEFLAIASGLENDPEEKIGQAVREYNAKAGVPFELSLSIGIVHADENETRTLKECVQAADVLMYSEKSRHKQGREA